MPSSTILIGVGIPPSVLRKFFFFSKITKLVVSPSPNNSGRDYSIIGVDRQLSTSYVLATTGALATALGLNSLVKVSLS